MRSCPDKDLLPTHTYRGAFLSFLNKSPFNPFFLQPEAYIIIHYQEKVKVCVCARVLSDDTSGSVHLCCHV